MAPVDKSKEKLLKKMQALEEQNKVLKKLLSNLQKDEETMINKNKHKNNNKSMKN